MGKITVSWFLICLFLFFGIAQAEDYTSSNFVDHDPVVTLSGGISTSTNFKLISGSGQTVVQESTSSNFMSRSGFFYFPSVTSPVVAATAGNAQVALTWTAADTSLGFTVSGYKVGQATVSGGPYSYSSVITGLASTRTGLTNSTAYYFVVRVLDAFSNVIATSTEVSATPVAPAPAPAPAPTPSSGGGGGGGGGGPAPAPQTAVYFNGRAYPNSTVTLLKDAQVAATTVAGPDAIFQLSLSGISAGNYIFSVYSEDKYGQRSGLLTFPVSVTAGATTNISGIFIAPTIAVDKSEVKRGDNIAIFGQSTPASDIVITVNSDNEYFVKTKADTAGAYLYNFDTSDLEYGSHLTKSKAGYNGEISSYSKAVGFTVGTKSVVRKEEKKFLKGDLNSDGRVNLIDFSIAAYWYKRPNPPANVDLNGDGKVNLVDFSIMAYYWTG